MNLDEKSYLERIADALEVINGGASTRTIDITENGTIDVKNYAYANVNVEDSGGGSGGMPFFTATIVNNTGYSMNQMDVPEKAEYGINVYREPIPANSTEIKEYLYTFGGDTIYYVHLSFSSLMQGNAVISYSDLVNCAYNEEMESLVITDITENASATLTLTMLQ